MQMDRSRQVSNIELPVWSCTWDWLCLMDYAVFYELMTWIQRPVRCGSARLQESETWMSLLARREHLSEGGKPRTCYGVASDRSCAFNLFVAPSTPHPMSHLSLNYGNFVEDADLDSEPGGDGCFWISKHQQTFTQLSRYDVNRWTGRYSLVNNSMFIISSFLLSSYFSCKRGVPVLPAALPVDCPNAGGWERGVPELHCEKPPAGPTETGGGGPHNGTAACVRPGAFRDPAVLQSVSLRKALSLKPDTQPAPGVKTFYSGVLG